MLDHLLELEALLDVATVTGFSLGLNELKLLQTKAELLGDFIGRDGREPSPERMKTIQEFPAGLPRMHQLGARISAPAIRSSCQDPWSVAETRCEVPSGRDCKQLRH